MLNIYLSGQVDLSVNGCLMDRASTLPKFALICGVLALGLCGCSNTIHRTVRYPYPVIQAHILKNGGKEIERAGQPWCELTIEEGSRYESVIDRTWIRATASGTNATR